VEYVYGGLFRATLEESGMIIPFVREIGGTCWVNPSISGEGYVDVVVSGWGRKNDTSRFMQEGPARLKALKKFLEEKRIVNFVNNPPEIIFLGTIRSQLARNQGYKRIYVAGDAAGMARPKTGDGFRWAIYGGEIMARAIENGVPPDRALAQFYTGDRAKWKDLLLQGATFYRLPKQRSGKFGTSVKPLGELIEKHRELQEPAINFFLKGGVDPKLLFALLEDSHFRGILIGSFLAQLRFFIQGEKSICPGYPFPELADS
jgi:flavin-dependent dehydrogenase